MYLNSTQPGNYFTGHLVKKFIHSQFCRFARYLNICALFLLFSFVSGHFAPSAHAKKDSSVKKLKIIKEFSGRLRTVNKGVGEDQPPYIRVFRTKGGLAFQMREFKKIWSRQNIETISHLSRSLKQIDLNSFMILGIMTFPTDNYSFTVKKVSDFGDQIEVGIQYSHRKKNYFILPTLSIHYRFLVVKKSHLPVVLKTKKITSKKKKKKKNLSRQSVFGKLKQWDNAGYSLGIMHRKKHKEYIYYIREPKWIEILKPHIGKTVGVSGYIHRKPGSVFEAEIKINKIIRIGEPENAKKQP